MLGNLRQSRYLGLTTLFVGLLLLLVACSDSSNLAVLGSEQVVELDLEAAADRRRSDHASGETFGKPNSAVVQLAFSPEGDRTLRDLLEEALPKVQSMGWDLEARSETSFAAEVERDGGVTRLEIYVAAESGELIVQLSR